MLVPGGGGGKVNVQDITLTKYWALAQRPDQALYFG